MLPPPHAALRSFAASSNGRKWTVHALLDERLHAHMWDHRVMGRALLPGAGFLEAGIAGAITALPVDVASAADVALLDCSVPVPMILPDPAKETPPPNAAKGSRGGKSSSSSRSASDSKVVGMEWCVENGSPHLEIASLSSHPLSSRPGKRPTPAHLRARLALVFHRSDVAGKGGDGGESGGGGSASSSIVSRGDAAVEQGTSTVTAVDEDDTVCARRRRLRRDAALHLLLFDSMTPISDATTTTAKNPSSGGIRAAVGVIAAAGEDDYLGYHVHPACVDNSMQLAAALASKDGRSKVMVPAGIKSFAAPTRAPRAHFLVGTADLKPPEAGAGAESVASQESSHRLMDRLGGGILAQLNDLEVKEMRRAPAAPAAPPKNAPSAAAAARGPLKNLTKGAAKVSSTEEPLPPRVTYSLEWLARAPSVRSRDQGGPDGAGGMAGRPQDDNSHNVPGGGGSTRSMTPLMMLPEARGGGRRGGRDSSSTSFSLPRRGRAHPTAVVSLLQNGAGNLAERALVRTLSGAVSTDGAAPFSSSSSSSTAAAAASAAATAAAMHGMARTAAQECRRTQLDSVDFDASTSFATLSDVDDVDGGGGSRGADHALHDRLPARSADPFARDPVTLGAAREGTSRGMQLRVPHLYPSHHVAKRAQPSPLKMPMGRALPPGKIAVRVRATSVSVADALMRGALRDDDTACTGEGHGRAGTNVVGFAGTVMDSGVFSPGEVGTAVFGVLLPRECCPDGKLQRENGADVGGVDKEEPRPAMTATTFPSSSSIVVVDAALCRPKPDALTFEEAAALPGPHVAAHAYLSAIRSSLSASSDLSPLLPGAAHGSKEKRKERQGDEEKDDVVILLQEYPGCPVAAALARLINRSDDRVRWIPPAGAGAGRDLQRLQVMGCGLGALLVRLPPGVEAVTAVVGRFDAPGAVAAALKVVRRGGVLVKTSTPSGAGASTWCSETVRHVISGVGPISGSFLRDAAAADPFVARPDVTFCADAMTSASLLRAAPAALAELARAVAEDGGGGSASEPLSRRLVSVPCAAAPPRSDDTTTATTAVVMNASLARYAMESLLPTRSAAGLVAPLAAVNAHHAPTPLIAQRPKPVLITGGLGAIGIEISLWLAQHHPVRVHLLGRSGRRSAAGGGGEAPDALGAHAGVVTIHRSDASFTEECSSVAEALRSNASSFNQQDALGSVLHASGEVLRIWVLGLHEWEARKNDRPRNQEGKKNVFPPLKVKNQTDAYIGASVPVSLRLGVLRDSMLPGQHAAGVREVFGAKISAAARLKDAARAQPLDGSVMFSSIAALMGSAGQTNYSVRIEALGLSVSS